MLSYACVTAQTSLICTVRQTSGRLASLRELENAMKGFNFLCVIGVGALISAAGCNKTEVRSPPPAASQTQSAPEPQSPPSTPTAPMPPPDAPKDEMSSGPKPGQVNDHSSPAFKGGKEGQK